MSHDVICLFATPQALARAYNAGFAAGIEEGSLFAADCLQEQLSNLGPSAQYNTGAPAPAALAPAGSIMLATPRHYTEKQTQDAATEVPAAKRACQAGMSELCLQPTTPQQCSRGASACAGPAHRPAWTPEVSVASTELPAASRVPRIHGFMLGYTNSLSRLTTDKVTAMNVLLHVAKRLDQT